MFERITEWSLRNRLAVMLGFACLLAYGAVSMWRLPIDAFPDTTPVQVQINTTAPALSAEEVEQQITLPVELSLGGLPGLVEVRSISKFGLSQVVATFADGTPIDDARQYVAERLATVELADQINRPELGPISTGLGEIFHYIVYSESGRQSLEELRTLHDWVIKPELRKVPGVAEVNAWGGKEKQFHVIVSPPALVEFGLTLGEVETALRENNQNVGGGQVVTGGRSLVVHGLGRVADVEQIENIVIASHDGVPVRVDDVAQVRIDHEIRRGAVTAQGRGEAVLGLAFMLMGENSQEVTERLKAQLERVRPALPEGVVVDVVYDRTELTTQVIDTVQHNLVAGAILVVLVLLVLLGNLRAGLLVAIVIPMAMLFAAVGMEHFAIAASLLSLGAIDFGIIVDGSVVMTEANMRSLAKQREKLGRKLTRGERLRTLIESSRSVARPVAFGMGIIMIVFFPILTLEGIEGKMFRPMAWTFIFAIAGALLLALMLSPVLGYYILPATGSNKPGLVMRAIGGLYDAVLRHAMRWRALVVAAAIGLLAVTGVTATKLGGEFVPRLGEGAISINTIRIAGISIEESVNYNTRIEQLLLDAFPDEVRRVWSRIGTAEVATDPMGIELTDIFVSLTPRDQWTKASNQAELVEAMQAVVADLPGQNMVFTQPIEMRINEMVSGIRSDVGIKVFGDYFDELVRISDDVQRVLLEVDGATDISGDQLTGLPKLQVRVDQDQIARLGVPTSDVLSYVEALGGLRVGQVFEGQRQFPLVLRLPDEHRRDPGLLASMLVPTRAGPLLPLSELAEVSQTEGTATINREWGRRLIRVQANVVGRDVASFVQEAQRRVREEVDLPPGYVIEWGGQFENLEQATLRLSIVVPVTLALVFFLLYLSLNNLRDVLLIYTGIPFAMVGAIFALWLRDIPLSVSAAVGFIALGGIAVLNGQILVSAIRENLALGQNVDEAVHQAAHQRLRPVLATAVTDALGFIPMAISTGIGAEVQRPLATVVVGGVITSTLLTLLVLPAIYTWLPGRGAPRDPAETMPEAAEASASGV